MPAAALAQNATEPGVIIRVTPPGAQVTLIGEARASGVSPIHFRQPLIGDYQLKVEKDGWETYKRSLILDPTRQITVDVDLSRKTRFKAAARSFFIPGWGQKYADEPTKAITFFSLAIGTGLAYLWADNEFGEKRDIFRQAERDVAEIEQNGSEAQLVQAIARLNEAHDEAQDAEDVRRVTIGAAIGVWALNMIDVLFFFPEEKGTFSIKGVAVSPGEVNGGFGVTLSTNF